MPASSLRIHGHWLNSNFSRNFIYKFYKRDDFNFHITNFPFLGSNIPTSPAYGVFISQLIRYARACSSYGCFILRATRLSNKLLEQGNDKERLKSSLRMFYGRYGDLIKQYEVSLSQILNDILWPDHIQWQPPTDQTLYRTRPFTEFWVVSIEHLRRVWHADRGRLLLRTPGPVPLGLAYVLLVETNPFPNLSLFFRTMIFEYPSVLSRYCFYECTNIKFFEHRSYFLNNTTRPPIHFLSGLLGFTPLFSHHLLNKPISSCTPFRRKREEHWIRQLGTVAPYGCNDHIDSIGNLTSPGCQSVKVLNLFDEPTEDIEVMAQEDIISPRYTMSPSTVFCRLSIYN